jgi:predicted Rossmann fold flavoprotein
MRVDAVVIGSGAAGMMCAIQAGLRGSSVVLLDHAKKLAEKIRVSGGGRCNFTNVNAGPEYYISSNPDFCRSALSRYGPRDFIALLEKHQIGYHEKSKGQLFCNDGSEEIIRMLREECDAAGVTRLMGCSIERIESLRAVDEGSGNESGGFIVRTSRGEFESGSLVVATGGLSIPKIGATPFGYKVAEQFNIPVIKPRPGLVPLTVAPGDWHAFSDLTGVSLDAEVRFGKRLFRDSVLITHRGLSGPGVLQISSYWRHGEAIHLNLLPDLDAGACLERDKASKKLLSNYLSQWLPRKFAEVWCAQMKERFGLMNLPLKQYGDKQHKVIAEQLQNWQIQPSGTMGYGKAEVTCGGVDTAAISSKTMECSGVPGLYFIGEVLDVTGQLGGHNFQWAWSSGYAAGNAL